MKTLHYAEMGTGHPVLLLHGFGADHRLMTGCMEPVFASRAPGWRRLYVDLPGMGRSPVPHGLRDSNGMVDVLEAFIAEKLAGGTFVLAGQSYGGYLARELVRRMPERIEGLLLICPAILPLKKDRDLPPGKAPREAADFGEFTVRTAEIRSRFEEEVGAGISIADRAFLKTLRPGGYPLSADPDELEAPFDRPALILLGRQDYIAGYRDAWKIIENYPRAAFAVLDRAGHNLQIEQPGLFNALVGEWLNRVAESLGKTS